MEWQPIDTAPKDGTEILAYNPVTGPYKTRFECDQFPMADWMGKVGGDVVPGIWYPKPTHWKTLPEPPVPVSTGWDSQSCFRVGG